VSIKLFKSITLVEKIRKEVHNLREFTDVDVMHAGVDCGLWIQGT